MIMHRNKCRQQEENLKQCGHNKMANILQTFSNAFYFMEKCILIEISQKIVPKGIIEE